MDRGQAGQQPLFCHDSHQFQASFGQPKPFSTNNFLKSLLRVERPNGHFVSFQQQDMRKGRRKGARSQVGDCAIGRVRYFQIQKQGRLIANF
ncbi:hypothetical protein ASG25_03180 [Rhizobium sp. Leaf384]|nr:hypothetical protein ASG25_03180 [Rhizobium sp. Leaf384]KQS82531.1 hypothetical protein ASG58_03995 [Rhizobium sp. Leaf383]